MSGRIPKGSERLPQGVSPMGERKKGGTCILPLSHSPVLPYLFLISLKYSRIDPVPLNGLLD